jgi:hypothetical protein
MREVLVPGLFTTEHRRSPIALIAAWLVVLQAFLAGVATARAGAMPASNPIEAAICHGAGDANSDDPAIPAEAAWHLCCAACTSAAPPMVSSGAPAAIVLESQRESRPVAFASFTLVLAHGAVRAGPSQAPPSRA